jgi:restriction system protein
VSVAVLWWFVARRWLARFRPNRWRALTLDQMLELTPAQFEQYVAERIFARQGYRAINTPDVKDGGVDIILYDAEGRQMIVQCKRYRSTVGEETVRDLYGALIHSGAEYAFLVTTGSISQPARVWAADKPIDLIDGPQLVALARSLPNHTS